MQAARERRLLRRYLAWVEGALSGAGEIVLPLARDPLAPQRMCVTAGGKSALTRYWVRQRHGTCTLLELELATGRNHQIRVHLAHIGHPVCGDPVYGTGGPFLALHAWKLGFEHPLKAETLVFEEPVPATWAESFCAQSMRQLSAEPGCAMGSALTAIFSDQSDGFVI